MTNGREPKISATIIAEASSSSSQFATVNQHTKGSEPHKYNLFRTKMNHSQLLSLQLVSFLAPP
jgi:hypothetical protein